MNIVEMKVGQIVTYLNESGAECVGEVEKVYRLSECVIIKEIEGLVPVRCVTNIIQEVEQKESKRYTWAKPKYEVGQTIRYRLNVGGALYTDIIISIKEHTIAEHIIYVTEWHEHHIKEHEIAYEVNDVPKPTQLAPDFRETYASQYATLTNQSEMNELFASLEAMNLAHAIDMALDSGNQALFNMLTGGGAQC